VRLYVEVAKRAFQRQLAYRTANLAGLVTNGCFGYLRGAVFVAVYQARENIAGYDVRDAITYMWVVQALLMVVVLWGWWDVESTIRSGDVVSDLSKPFSYLGFWLARDYGRALYYVLFRGVPVFVVGQIMFGLRWPASSGTWLAFAASVVLAVAVSFAWRFIINLTAFWTTEARGLGQIAMAAVTVLSGFLVPIGYFPDAVQGVLVALPFASMFQIPADVFLERLSGADLLLAIGRQAFWAALLLAMAQLLVIRATRRVVVQGG